MMTDGDVTVEDGDEREDVDDFVSEGDESAYGDAQSSEGTWYDAASGLTWQNPPSGGSFEYQQAIDFCNQLALGGHSDWRLPTISELRSLIRGCPNTVTGGICGVTDGCLQSSCYDDNSCAVCAAGDGPAEGCYWPDEMEGTCSWYWSSSPVKGDDGHAWGIYFSNGGVDNGYISGDNRFRCVR